MRIYHNYSAPDVASWEILQESFGSVSNVWDHVDLCYVRDVRNITKRQSNYVNPMTWRFLPVFDTFVDVFLCRDADTLITQREIEAVNEWYYFDLIKLTKVDFLFQRLASDKTFHVMRDHPTQCEPILSGNNEIHLVLISFNNECIKMIISRTVGCQIEPETKCNSSHGL